MQTDYSDAGTSMEPVRWHVMQTDYSDAGGVSPSGARRGRTRQAGRDRARSDC